MKTVAILNISLTSAHSIFSRAARSLFVWALLFLSASAIHAELIYTEDSGAITITGYSGTVIDLTIPDLIDGLPVKAIRAKAFFQRLDLKSVMISDGTTSIGFSAFYGCSSLTNITLPNSLTNLGNYAFDGCYGLTSVTLPNSLTTIGYAVFEFCNGLTNVTIPTSVTSIGEYAFLNCVGLTDLPLPNSVTNLGDYAFSQCTGLTRVTIPNSVTTIGIRALSHCFNVTNVIIPNSVTTLAREAFYYCTNLASVTIPDSVTSIEPEVFFYCNGLRRVTIPSSVTSIGAYAFHNCISLTNVTIPNSVNTLGEHAFSQCISLTNVMIPSGVTNIGDSAFSICTNLAAISVDGDNPTFSSLEGVLFNKTQTTLIQYPMAKAGRSYSIPTTAASIGASAFLYCSNLTSVTIPKSVTKLGDFAFAGCSKLEETYFQGNRPLAGVSLFGDSPATIYYLSGTIGWEAGFAGRLAVLWNPHAPTGDPVFGVRNGRFGFNITGPTNFQVIVEACENLTNPVWVPVGTNIFTSGYSSFSDETWKTHPARIYRFRSP